MKITQVPFTLACSALLLAVVNASFAQQPYQPAVAPASTNVYGGGGYYGGGGAQTAQGAALQGMSQVISAAGEYNLNTSAAAINMTEARSNELNNEVQAVQTFWAKRNIGREERARERGPNRTPEEIARYAKYGIPKGLTPSQMDPVSGKLNWPGPLQDAGFETQRSELDKLMSKLVAYGGLDYNDQTSVRQNVDSMYETIKEQISQIPPQTYMASKNFLQSVIYAATRTTL